MTTGKQNAPGGRTGGAQDERSGGRVVMPSIRRPPVAYASLYAPAGRRTMWWLAYRCPHCGAGHFGRVRDQQSASGVRRAGCGRLTLVKIARTYRPGGTR